ncbi:protein kinase family protein [Mycobacterium sp. JS623]|uniref:serine/threonine-protein kinase n=1 Tax=Mycobacterium sp. JS623 TaxID=212767 RepID=UPI0002A5AD53|nr:serine/threonine-protein kinase [Mycobacterium sp. JS623]AGB25383.1 protein kinase family protein [Mycobacterium sp. JS623]
MVSLGGWYERYVVDATLGHGGYATVYLAHDAVDRNRRVALKILDDFHCEPAQIARLQREFDFAHQLDHPHIIKVYECGEGWLAMELVEGGTATELQGLPDRLAALAQIADALDYAHRLGIVHCDVKPSNILASLPFSKRGAVLIDFGVARAVAEDVGRRPTHVEASLPYSAPELLRGQPPSAATDEYALACTAFELITGSPPFTAATSIDLMDEQLHKQPPTLSRKIEWLPHAFDSIMSKALAKTPDNRYDSCAEFIALITRALR